MTVKQAIDRISAERLSGKPAKEWVLSHDDIRVLFDELASDAHYEVMDKPTAIERGVSVPDRPPPRREGYAMTFMGVDIYRAA